MARRLDRRVQRTRKLLRDSMLALILEEGYDDISIQDITDKANLGRATFYLHFKDKDELLLEVMDQFLKDFLDQVPKLSTDQWRLEDPKALAKIFDFAAEHYDLYRILMISSGGITATRQLHHTLAESLKEGIQAEVSEKGSDPLIPVDFIANHFAGALLATIYWWLDNDLPYSVDEMAEMFQKVNQADQDRLLGFTGQTQEKTREKNARGKKRAKEKDDSPKVAETPPGAIEPPDVESLGDSEQPKETSE